MSREQRKMMINQDKMVDQAADPLTALFRLILRELNIRPESWSERLTRWLKRKGSSCANNSKDIGQERNNFNRAISKQQITAKTFQKAIWILGPVKYSMSINFTMPDGKSYFIETKTYRRPWKDQELKDIRGDEDDTSTSKSYAGMGLAATLREQHKEQDKQLMEYTSGIVQNEISKINTHPRQFDRVSDNKQDTEDDV